MLIIIICYSDVSQKISGPYVEAVGDSDHLGVRILKFSKSPPSRPQVIKRRIYKNFSTENFLTDIFHSNINISVTSHNNIETASEAFRNEFNAILDVHAPIKTIQIRRRYCPYLSEETKLLMKDRDVLHKEATKHGDPDLLKEFKEKAKEVKKAVEKDKKLGMEKDLGDSSTVNGAWRAAKNTNQSPTQQRLPQN